MHGCKAEKSVHGVFSIVYFNMRSLALKRGGRIEKVYRCVNHFLCRNSYQTEAFFHSRDSHKSVWLQYLCALKILYAASCIDTKQIDSRPMPAILYTHTHFIVIGACMFCDPVANACMIINAGFWITETNKHTRKDLWRQVCGTHLAVWSEKHAYMHRQRKTRTQRCASYIPLPLYTLRNKSEACLES